MSLSEEILKEKIKEKLFNNTSIYTNGYDDMYDAILSNISQSWADIITDYFSGLISPPMSSTIDTTISNLYNTLVTELKLSLSVPAPTPPLSLDLVTLFMPIDTFLNKLIISDATIVSLITAGNVIEPPSGSFGEYAFEGLNDMEYSTSSDNKLQISENADTTASIIAKNIHNAITKTIWKTPTGVSMPWK
jgi:hypothetical protein